MRVSAITPQSKRKDRFSVFVDGEYAFSLSESALLKSKVVSGMELDERQLKELTKLANADKLYIRALNLVSARAKTRWEVELYLKRKDASPALISSIVNKLSDIGLIDDDRYAQDFVRNRDNLRPTSRRKIRAELMKKRVAEDAIDKALGNSEGNDLDALIEIIGRKRKQARYRDDEKLMQYLARQGFSYHDIKAALNQDQDY